MDRIYVEVRTDDGKFPAVNSFTFSSVESAIEGARFARGLLTKKEIDKRGIRIQVREHTGDFTEKGRLKGRLIKDIC